ncbi:Glycosyltransferase family 92 protein [Aphelenchoides besseyi]|nr:Glycosyltransferase family 92 protein [Aphelenchoides besseyi]
MITVITELLEVCICRQLFDFEITGKFIDFVFTSSFCSLNRLSDTQTIRISGLVEKDAQIPSLMCKSEHGEIVTAIAFQSSGPGQCRWSDYYLDCPFSLSANRIAIYSGEPGANQINNWQIALASLELYRHFGVSLFNIPIISVISDLYKIFKSYESEGLVRFGHGVVMPKKMKGLNYNPNSEVEFFNQVISNSECLFEYRDHSDFMLFVDVDDILIPRLTNSLINEVLYHQKLHPLGGAFEFLWSRSSVVQLEEFSIKRMMEHVYINDTMPNVGKSIVVSKRMNLGVMHHALQSEDIVEGYSSILMTEDDMLAIHLRNQVFNGEQEWAFKELPEERYYYNLMVDCYNDEKQKVREHDLTNCPNPLHCKPKINAKNPGPECVVLKSTYQHVQPVGSFHIYAPEHKWLSNEKNCLF